MIDDTLTADLIPLGDGTHMATAAAANRNGMQVQAMAGGPWYLLTSENDLPSGRWVRCRPAPTEPTWMLAEVEQGEGWPSDTVTMRWTTRCHLYGVAQPETIAALGDQALRWEVADRDGFVAWPGVDFYDADTQLPIVVRREL